MLRVEEENAVYRKTEGRVCLGLGQKVEQVPGPERTNVDVILPVRKPGDFGH